MLDGGERLAPLVCGGWWEVLVSTGCWEGATCTSEVLRRGMNARERFRGRSVEKRGWA